MAAAYPDAPEPAALALYRQARLLHVVVWVYALLPEFPDWEEHAKAFLERLRGQVEERKGSRGEPLN